MRKTAAVVTLAAALVGCASWPPVGRGAFVVAEGDRLAREGDFAAAVAKYDEYLSRYPDGWSATHAQKSRDTLSATLSARGEAARLRQEVVRLRDELARRETELVRVREEADRLRADLERLKQIDLRLERTK
jgi:hypothetical protein